MSAMLSMLRTPSGGPGEALGRDTLAVAADVVDAAGQQQRRDERAPGIGGVEEIELLAAASFKSAPWRNRGEILRAGPLMRCRACPYWGTD